MNPHPQKTTDPIVRLNVPITKQKRRMAKIAALKAGLDLQDFVVKAIMEKIERDGK